MRQKAYVLRLINVSNLGEFGTILKRGYPYTGGIFRIFKQTPCPQMMGPA